MNSIKFFVHTLVVPQISMQSHQRIYYLIKKVSSMEAFTPTKNILSMYLIKKLGYARLL